MALSRVLREGAPLYFADATAKADIEGTDDKSHVLFDVYLYNIISLMLCSKTMFISFSIHAIPGRGIS